MKRILDSLVNRYPLLKDCRSDIKEAYLCMKDSFENGGKLLVCGNGGSAADSEHIVGELMKSFYKKRSLDCQLKNILESEFGDKGIYLAQKLQGALPAISLTCHSALNTAFINDVDVKLIFAQQVIGYGTNGDVLLGISTSGNAENIINAMITARAKGIKVIGLTGREGGRFKEYCDIMICVSATITGDIQELHLPIYHAICQQLEEYFF